MRLTQLNAANRLDDMHLPSSNRLEALKHDRIGQWSIRVNDQWRICFRFENGDAFDVEIVDYHSKDGQYDQERFAGHPPR